MARNSSGTYSLPSAAPNPVISGTTITSTGFNTTAGDIATELTDSLSRTGKGGMTAPLRCADGTVAAPAHSFTSETGSGWFRHAAGELRLAILGVYRIAVTAAGAVVNGTLQAIGKITASAGLDVTGTLAVIDDGGTTKKVTVDAPTGLAADYALTLPTALPGSTLPVTMTSAGALSTGQLVNSQQNFGTPSAATDVVIKSFLDVSTSAVTSLHANLSNAPSSVKNNTQAWLLGSVTNPLTATGAVTGCSASGSPAGANVLFRIPAGYRMAGAGATRAYVVPIYWSDASASNALKMGALVCENGNGDVYFFDGSGGNLATGDAIYICSSVPWQAA